MMKEQREAFRAITEEHRRRRVDVEATEAEHMKAVAELTALEAVYAEPEMPQPLTPQEEAALTGAQRAAREQQARQFRMWQDKTTVGRLKQRQMRRRLNQARENAAKTETEFRNARTRAREWEVNSPQFDESTIERGFKRIVEMGGTLTLRDGTVLTAEQWKARRLEKLRALETFK